MSTDLALQSDEAPSLIGNWQLGLSIQLTNNTGFLCTSPTLYVVVVYEGVFNVLDGNASHMIGVLSRSDILNAHKNPFITYKRAKDVWGGRFFDKVKGLARKAHDVVKRGKILSTATSLIPHPAAQASSRVLSNLGYGYSGGHLDLENDTKRVKQIQKQQQKEHDRQTRLNNRQDSYESCNKKQKISKLLKASDLYDNEVNQNDEINENDFFDDSDNEIQSDGDYNYDE